MLGLALAIEAGIWKKKDFDEVEYRSPMMNVGYLFPDRMRDVDPAKYIPETLLGVESADGDDEHAGSDSDPNFDIKQEVQTSNLSPVRTIGHE